jgi:NADH-quinone oxidoreductase subunit M
VLSSKSIFFSATFLEFWCTWGFYSHSILGRPTGMHLHPTAVSMLHAGVLMKLGGYGCFRVAIYLMPEGADTYTTLFLVLTGISVVYGALGQLLDKKT